MKDNSVQYKFNCVDDFINHHLELWEDKNPIPVAEVPKKPHLDKPLVMTHEKGLYVLDIADNGDVVLSITYAASIPI